MDNVPPVSVIKHLPILAIVNLARVSITAAIQKNCLEHVLLNLIEDMDIEDLQRMKIQLDRVEGLAGMLIKKRIKWNDWPTTGPVTPMPYSPYVDGKFVP